MILLSFKSLAKNYYLYISWGGYLFCHGLSMKFETLILVSIPS